MIAPLYYCLQNTAKKRKAKDAGRVIKLSDTNHDLYFSNNPSSLFGRNFFAIKKLNSHLKGEKIYAESNSPPSRQ